ncbi:MAG: hypothetical protein INR64_18815, partial [Caulobacteraceae bacterium]|nr:hypothetical protein [Caulobacter sp.]
MSLPQADVPAAADPPAARPYGLLGLVVSCALILVGACLIFAILAALVALAVVGAFGWQAVLDRVGHPDPSDQPKLVLVASMPFYAAIVAAVLVAARIRGGSRWRDLVAFKPWNPLRGAAWMWGLTAAMIVWGTLANAAIEHLKPGVNQLDHLPTGLRWRFVVLILAAVFAPIAEETLFR